MRNTERHLRIDKLGPTPRSLGTTLGRLFALLRQRRGALAASRDRAPDTPTAQLTLSTVTHLLELPVGCGQRPRNGHSLKLAFRTTCPN